MLFSSFSEGSKIWGGVLDIIPFFFLRHQTQIIIDLEVTTGIWLYRIIILKKFNIGNAAKTS